MSFVRYPHLEKLGNVEVEAIEFGTAHVFPKLDGTNASMWMERNDDGWVERFGSRNRQLTIDNDNAGFMNAMVGPQGEPYRDLLEHFPELRMFGEWLVPHTLKDYRDDAWRRFYIFDVYDDSKNRFLSYEEYKPLLDQFPGIDYIPCIKIIKNGTREMFLYEINNARFMLKEEAKTAEGIVIKNYAWENKFKRQTWAKIIAGEFKDDFHKQWGPAEQENRPNEEILVDRIVTPQLVEKEYAKIVVENDGWSSKSIPRLLETVFRCVVVEELYDCWKDIKHGTINGKSLRAFTYQRVKQLKPELF